MPTIAALIQRTNPVGSAQYFQQFCELLGDGIIGGIWLYGSLDPNSVSASIEVLPPVLQALGIGCSRYLKACCV